MIKIVLQSLYGNALTSSSHKDTFPPLIAICQIVNSQCELFQLVVPFAQHSLAVCNPLVILHTLCRHHSEKKYVEILK